jgi:hypothetical protein
MRRRYRERRRRGTTRAASDIFRADSTDRIVQYIGAHTSAPLQI